MAGLPIPTDVAEFFGDRMLVCYMATVRPDGALANVAMGVVIHEGRIRISTPAETLKVRNLRQNPQVALCVPYPEDARRFLMIRGTVEIAEDTDRQFVRWITRTHMGRDEHPFDPPRTPRVVITLVPERFIFSGAQGTAERTPLSGAQT